MGALDGILVIGIEQAVAAPLCTLRLAQAGARVIKVEHPDGDFARGYDAAVHGESSYFVWLNGGKESVVLDIKAPGDRAILDRMIAVADVVVQNLAPDSARRLGIDAASLVAAHPRLVAVDIIGYRPVGPYAEYKGYDLLIQAETGLADITGLPAGPGRVGISVADIGAGTTAYALVLEALIARSRTLRGAPIVVSLFDCLAEWMTVPYLHQKYTGAGPRRVGLAHPSIAPYGAFEAEDGVAIVISVQSDREWAVLAEKILGRPDLARDPRTATNVARVKNRVFVDDCVGAFIRSTPSEIVVAALLKNRIAFGKVGRLDAVIANPLLRWQPVQTATGVADIPVPTGREALGLEAGPVPQLDSHGAALRREFAP